MQAVSGLFRLLRSVSASPRMAVVPKCSLVRRDSPDISSYGASPPQSRTPSLPPQLPVLPKVAQSAMAKNDTTHDLDSDPNQWLEDVTGDKALDWVRARNSESTKSIGSGSTFEALRTRLREVMDSKEKIPHVAEHVGYYYNFWKDADHPRGVWRRTTLEEYRKTQPTWETVLDIDALCKAEGKNWVFGGSSYLEPECKRAIVSLSPGGSDAAVRREFDVVNKRFIDDGFVVPEAKSRVAWVDENTLFVGSDFGEGTMTTSGYPRTVRRWTRGTKLENAPVIFEGQATDVSVGAYHDPTPGFERSFVSRAPTFFTGETFWIDKAGEPRKIDIPDDAEPSFHREWMMVHLRTPWIVGDQTFAAGELVVTKFDAFMEGKREFVSLFKPTATTSLDSMAWTRDHLLLNVLEDVKNRVHVLTPKAQGPWRKSPLPGAPAVGSVAVWPEDELTNNKFFMTIDGFLAPTALFYGDVEGGCQKLKETPAFFDGDKYTVTQYFATSKDGTRVPYFEVSAKNVKLDGNNLTLLTGYGGFEVSNLPYYSGTVGRGWLNDGGVYVLANIRGGGEYGPAWHQAALKEKRPRAYEDFAAVAEDLVKRKVTSPKHLGIQGGSNGGLLVGNMLTTYPNLIGAVVCEVPLLDMKRYSHLLAGASWMGEYGDPDKPEEWAFIQKFSPYHNLKEGVTYPPVLFMTSTRDDRVHPGHARKMAERMRGMGSDVTYYENIEGGHGGAADNAQASMMRGLAFTFLRNKLG